jgi:hypothetical protein
MNSRFPFRQERPRAELRRKLELSKCQPEQTAGARGERLCLKMEMEINTTLYTTVSEELDVGDATAASCPAVEATMGDMVDEPAWRRGRNAEADVVPGYVPSKFRNMIQCIFRW